MLVIRFLRLGLATIKFGAPGSLVWTKQSIFSAYGGKTTQSPAKPHLTPGIYMKKNCIRKMKCCQTYQSISSSWFSHYSLHMSLFDQFYLQCLHIYPLCFQSCILWTEGFQPPKKVRPVRIIIWCLRANAAWRHRKTWLTLSDRWGNHWSGWSSGHQTSPVVQTCWNLKPSCLTFPNKIAFATHWLQFLLPFRLLDLPVNTVSGPVPFGHRETLRCRHRCLNTLIDHLKTVGDLSRLGSGSCDFFFSLGWFGLWCLWEKLW